MNLISAKKLRKSYFIGKDESIILNDVDLEISEGEFISIMGPSGVGKSTLLYLLGGLDTPTSGEVIISGKSFNDMKEKEVSKLRRSYMGFVFQFYNLVSNLSVEDNIMLPLMLDGKKIRNYKDRVDELLCYIGMEDKRKLTPRELSGGQQQRVAIARALVYDPEILLLDEPIGNLDSKSGTEIMELFQKINLDMNKTIIQVTHSEQSARYGTFIYRMLDGEINSIEEVKG
ncbi:MAG: ABC transporter ATP-binding protein [Clostridiales bacterium]|nr:ABC transporter ATP-binding protein [Clostridiales bacterium]